MITFLHGKLVEALPTQVVVDVNGVGYEALIPLSSFDKLPQPGGVTVLVRDPERRDRLYAATATGHIFESGNRGLGWQSVSAGPAGQINYLYIIRF